MEQTLPLKRVRSVISGLVEVTEDFDQYKYGDIIAVTTEYYDKQKGTVKQKFIKLQDEELVDAIKKYNSHFIFP